jgi:hypothetical protein
MSNLDRDIPALLAPTESRLMFEIGEYRNRHTTATKIQPSAGRK